MLSFNLRKPRAANYTPASLMHEYAKAGRVPYVHDWTGTGVIINGRVYYYDHWSIEDNNDGTETVTVYMEED